MQYAELTEKVIGCAYKVYNQMGFGFLESVYENCLAIELRRAGIDFETQKSITVHYGEDVVGEFFADVVIEGKVIVELKSVRQLAKAHEIQLVNYLVATKTDVGLLVNFGEENVEVKRKSRTLER